MIMVYVVSIHFQVVNVQVPFIFKYAVDYLNNSSNWLNMADPTSTILTTATALVIGCKYKIFMISAPGWSFLLLKKHLSVNKNVILHS